MRQLRRLGWLAAVAVVVCLCARGSAAEWTLAFEDDFSRKALGTDWLVLRGDWHINADGQLQIQRQWSSHSFIACTVPLRGKNVRAEFDLIIPSAQRGSFGAFLQAGALRWGGGGVDDRVGAEVVGCTPEEMGKRKGHCVLVDKVHHVVLSLTDGHFSVVVDGNTIGSGTIPQGRSLYNSGLQFAVCPGAKIDNVRIFTAPMAKSLPALNVNTAAENGAATVFARDFYDPKLPDCGFQRAIDSLPRAGGVVILPKGTFVLRRFLDVHSNTTLAGQGPETVLQVMDATAAPVTKVLSEKGVCKLVLKGPHDFKPGDSFSYGNSWGHPINSKGPGQTRLRNLLGGGSPSENRLPALTISGAKKKGEAYTDDVLGPGDQPYNMPPRYFVVARNQVEKITLFKYARGHVIAANRTADGKPTLVDYRVYYEKPSDEKPVRNIIADDAQVVLPRLPAPIERTTPLGPPKLREPVIDAREVYNAKLPDCGFQKGLDRLAGKGGTLLLPGGRYAIATALVVPSNVTLAGRGTGTVLLSAKGNTVITTTGTQAVRVRDLAIEGDWTTGGGESAVAVDGRRDVELIALDVRGCRGDGISASGEEITILDCRVRRCGGWGYRLDASGLRCESNWAVQCAGGFLLAGGTRQSVAGNISALHHGPGYVVKSTDAVLAANNAHNNLEDGILVDAPGRGVVVTGNTCDGNNQAGKRFAGIRVAGATACSVMFNDCGDEQLYATQLVGIRAEAAASQVDIRYNSTATVCTRRGHETEPSLVCEAKASTVAGNWTETLMPSNDSIESIAWKQAHPKKK